jgi:hypothetical protein
MSAELDKARAHVDRIDGKRATEADRLSRQVIWISSVLVDMGMMLIQDIP